MTRKIAIIGGGFTGLTAALRLLQNGYKVTIFEKDDRLGGLASGFDIGNNVILEKAYHFLYTSDSEALGLLEELGIRDKLTFYDSSVSTYFDANLYPFASGKDLLLFKPLSFLNRIRTGLVALYLQRLKNWEPLTNITALAWMKKYAGIQATEVIWKPLLRGKFGKYYDKILMSWLWTRIRVRVTSKEEGVKNEQLGYIDKGFSTFIHHLEEEIVQLGGEIRLSSAVSQILSKDGEVLIKVDNQDESFDSVISALATNVFAGLIKNNDLPVGYLDKLNSINYVGAITYVFSSEQEISKYYWHNVNDVEIPFLVFLSQTALVDKEKFGNKHIYYTGTYVEHEHRYFSCDNADIIGEWRQGLKKMFPEFDSSKIIEEKMFKFKNSQHIVDIDYKDKIPAYKSKLKNVYLANFSQIYPDDRGLNYAIKEGTHIANILIKEDEDK